MATNPTDEELYGDFHSPRLEKILGLYFSFVPLTDLPSDRMLNLVLLFLRSLFSSLGEEHEYRWLGNLQGGEEDPQTGITILVADTVDQEVLEQKPAILVKLGGRDFLGLHLDQQRHWNTYHNARALQDLLRGRTTVTVLSQTEALARRLSEWIGLNIRVFAHNLTFGGFHAIYPQVHFSETKPATEFVRGSSDHEYVAAQAVFQFTWNWVATMLSTSTKKIASIEVDQLIYESPSLDFEDGESGIVEPVVAQQLLIEPVGE